MDKVHQFRHRARECRISATRAHSSELRSHYEQLAMVWDRLADERLAFFVEQPEDNGPRRERRGDDAAT